MTGRTGRPAAGGRDTRSDILRAARTLFADLGFERTTMRAVAARAGVDVALIYHHYGSKDELLAAALTVPESARPVLRPVPAGTSDPGREITRAILDLWENDPTVREQTLAMVRTALSHEHAARRLEELHSSAVLALVSEVIADDSKDLRAGLIGAHLSGLLLTRYLFKVPAMATADAARLVDAAGPVIDHYLAGDIAP